MRESLDDLGFRHAEEEVWPAARVSRRRLDLGRRRRQWRWRRQRLGFGGEDLVSLGGSPAPPYIGGGTGRPSGGRGVPPQLGLEVGRRVGGGNPPPPRFPPLP